MYMDYTYYIIWVLKQTVKMAKVVRKETTINLYYLSE